MLYIILFCITLFLFAPSMIYICNISEFWFTPDLYYPYITLCTLVVILGLVSLGCILRKTNHKWFEIFAVGFFFLTIIIYIQGNFIPDSNGELDGNLINWRKVTLDMILSDILWFLGILTFLFCIIKKKCHSIYKLQKEITVFFLCFEILVTCFTLFSVGGFDFEKERVCSVKGELELSQNTNMIILMPDRFDGKYLKDNISSAQMDSLEDFTFFCDTMGAFGRTSKAFPQILTGIPYFYENEYNDYLYSAYKESPLLKKLSENDWSVGIYTCESIPQNTLGEPDVENFSKVKLKINSKKSFLIKIYKIVGYAYAPYHLKRFFEIYSDTLIDHREIIHEYPVYWWKNYLFYNNIDNFTASRNENVFRFYHIEGLHTSTTTAQCTESSEEQPLIDIFQGNMLLIDKFLSKLKDEGIYDNSIIIIMGDHGNSSDSREGWDECFWGTNPCLLIKGINEKHNFTISEKPLSYFDLQQIFSNLLEGLTADESTDFISNDTRERLFYRIDAKDWDSLLIEYSSNGPAYDYTQMQPTGNEYHAK